MANLLLHGLSPGTLYAIQVRATNGSQVSDWSQLYTFYTIADTMPPASPTNLVWQFVGTALSGTWDAPTTNQDGTPLRDFKDYEVMLTANGISVVYYVTEPRFDFTFEQNRSAFGRPMGTVDISVAARDITGNVSAAITATAINPPPQPPQNVSAIGLNEAVSVKWDANTVDADLDHYEVNMSTTTPFTPALSNLAWFGSATNVVIPTGTDYSTRYLQVCCVDVFGTPSTYVQVSATPKSSFTVDTTPPPTPTALTVTGATDAADPSGSKVIATVGWTMAAPPSDLAGFTIRYQRNGDTNWSYFDVPDESMRSVTIPNLATNVAYNFQIAAYDYTDNESTYTATTALSAVKDTTAPGTPSAPTAITSTQSIQIYHPLTLAAGGNLPADTDYFEVYASQTTGFTPTKATDTTNNYLGNLSVTPPFAGNVVPAIGTFSLPAKRSSDTDNSTTKTYYVKVIAVDSSGNRSTASAQATATVGLIDNLSIGNAVITTANIHDVTADKITAGAGFINNLSVFSTLTIGNSSTAGFVQSSDYAAGSLGWQLSKTGLEINAGSISAKTLKLQVGQNLIPVQYADFEFNSTFYTATQFVTSGSPTLTISGTAKVNTQSLSIAAGATAPTVDFTPAATTYNMAVEPGQTYIVSAYVQHNNAAAQNFAFRFKDDVNAVTTSGNVSVPTGTTWTRVSATFTAASSASVAWVGVSLPASVTWLIDAIQVEKQTGSLTTPSAWRPSSTTTIDGGMIKTGSIQSTSLVSTGLSSGSQPQWLINMAGNAVFANLLVRGHAVVGDSSNNGNTSDQWIGSANYAAGSAGWIIKGDGSGEFNNVTVRGTVYMSGGSVPGSTVSGNVGGANNASNLTGGSISGSNTVTGSVTSSWPSGSARVELNSSGLFAYNSGGGQTVAIHNDGSATFSGTVSGSTIYGNTIQTGSYVNAPTRIEMNSSATDRMYFYNGGNIVGVIGGGGGTGPFFGGTANNESGWNMSTTQFNLYGGGPGGGGVSMTTSGTQIDGAIKTSGTVTSFTGTAALGDNQLRIRGSGDGNHYLGYYSMRDGPILQGAQGGALATSTYEIAYWNNGGIHVVTGNVVIDSGGAFSTSGSVFAANVGTVGTPPTLGNSFKGSTRSAGNSFSFDWSNSTSTPTSAAYYIQCYIDDSFIARIQRGAILNSGTKSFVIDHPKAEKTESEYLVHACIEGPENAVFYRGRGRLSKGVAIVELPDYFTDLCDEETATVHITPVATWVHDHHGIHNDDFDCAVNGETISDEFGGCHGHTEVPNLTASLPHKGRFWVGRSGGFSGEWTEEAEFTWMVMATRKDVSNLEVEVSKEDFILNGDGPYTYLTRR